MNSRIERFLIALMFALLMAGVTLVLVSAQEGGNPGDTQQNLECATCHTEFHMTWQSGAHGQSGNDPVFLAEWERQGKPGACLVCHTTGYDPATATYEEAGVACKACHEPVPADHPKTPMPVDRSTDLCGRCHSDTRFGWQDWQVSAHYQRGMDCVTCHDPHSASVKKVAAPFGSANSTDDISQLCINCHKEYSMDFSYTTHHQQGISCVDCHVNHLENDERTAHMVPDHSFNASLQSCNTCHAEQMHKPTEPTTLEGTSAPSTAQATESTKLASVTPEPAPVSPIGFSVLAGLIGLAAGMVLAPWLEQWYRHVAQRNTEEGNE
ncbi:MAG TPA: cytochrome c3 family protein [Anaerolineales bacterium]|nr:cytochrome c3 family protein [Anaerolineales bacterium]